MYYLNNKIMKSLLTTISILTLVLSFHSLQAKVIIVNNNAGQPTDIENFYDNLQDAINAAISGEDTIYVVGSPTIHSTIEINKKLTLIGPGYFLGENKNVDGDEIQTQANLETAKLRNVTIQEDGDGTIITGFDFSNSSLNTISIDQGCQNVELIRNKIYRIGVSGENTLVRENFILGVITLYTGSSNAMIRNNIILDEINQYSLAQGVSGVEIVNNTLNDQMSGIKGANFDNNIFINDEPLSSCTNNTFRHNVFTVSVADVFTGDQNNNTYENLENAFSAARNSLFIASEQTLDGDYQLAENSPAKGAGLDDIDAGAFTSDVNSYKRSGLPAVPAIYEYTIHNGVGTAETGIKVTIKAKSHN